MHTTTSGYVKWGWSFEAAPPFGGGARMLPPFSRELQASRFSVGPIQNPSCWECRSRPKLSSPALMCPPPRNPPRLSSAQAQNMASKT